MWQNNVYTSCDVSVTWVNLKQDHFLGYSRNIIAQEEKNTGIFKFSFKPVDPFKC